MRPSPDPSTHPQLSVSVCAAKYGMDNDLRRWMQLVESGRSKPVWYHGTAEPFDGPFDLDRFGSGAIGDYARAGIDGWIPAVYLSNEREHAESYGVVVITAELDRPDKVIKVKSEMVRWAKEQGYKSAQQMIDDYYDGQLYQAIGADSALNDAAREAKAAGHKVIVFDFGDLRGWAGDVGKSKTYGGKIAVVLDPSAIRRINPTS